MIRSIVAGRKAERFTGDASQQLSMQILGTLLAPDEEALGDANDDAEIGELADEGDDAVDLGATSLTR